MNPSHISKKVTALTQEQRDLLFQSLRGKSNGIPAVPLQPQQRQTNRFPLSFAQQRLWILDQFSSGTPFYNIFVAPSLDMKVDWSMLEASLNALVRRHESLRTSFERDRDEPVQVIAPFVRLPLVLKDLQYLPEAERTLEVRRLADEEAQKPFDLSAAPLLRATLLRLSVQRHILMLTIHHIISDGWSLGVFWHELGALYMAFCSGRRSPLAALPIQYVDYAVWERQQLQGPRLDEQLSYWRQRLSLLEVLRLPTDFPRPSRQNFRGAAFEIVLPGELIVRLRRFSRNESGTLFMTLLAGFQILLYQYCGQTDIVVGSPIANRNRPELEGIIGFFVNTLVMRTDLSGNPTVRELFGRVRETALGAYEHSDVPFEKLVAEVQPNRDLSRNPLFQVMFQLFTSGGPSQGRGNSSGQIALNRGTAMFDIAFHLFEGTDEIRGQIEYSTDLFRPETIERMAWHFRVVLEAMVADWERRLGDLPLLSRTEREQILVEWNNTAREWGRASTLVELFQQQVERSPESEAVADRHERLTYCELNRRANRLAHYLQRLETGPEAVVCLYLERSVEAVVAMLGILKAGAAYLPLDPAYPQDRLAWMVTDAGSRVVVTNVCMRDSLPVSGMQIVCVDQVPEQSETNPDIAQCAASAAYVIYTSGSTGWPKGIVGLHGATVNRLEWMWREFPQDVDSVGCQKTALSFVDSVWEVFGGLLQGVRTVILAESEVKDGEEFLERLAQEQVTRVVVVPSLLRVLLEMKKDLGSALPRLREWFVSGEKLGEELWERFQERVPGGRLINLYGSSEVAGDATWYELGAGSGVAIGRPIANTRVYVLDEQLRPLPVGIPGDLYLGGAALARGYLGRPDLTAERFLPNPHAVQPGERMYWTGDLVRWRADGALEYLGRRDQQVKIRGFRIELGEIEAELKKHPEVKESVVLAQLEGDGEVRLFAYVVPERPDQPPAELESYLRKTLPRYMIPSSVAFLDQLPLTSNGKIDRQSLGSEGRTNLKGPGAHKAPRNSIEQSLTRIWSELLSITGVGIDDDFFELGGHSLLAIRVMTRLRETFQLSLPLTTIFEEPTIAGLARAIEKMKGRAAVLEPRITKEGRDAYRLRL